MLIYNSQKEFIGIDEEDLTALGFSDLSQLMSESKEFSDLFVKTPGYIHNFKHVHWIDYILCMEDDDESKVIIHTNDKSYKCDLTIKKAYLTSNPSEQAYLINLKNLRVLTDIESVDISNNADITTQEVDEKLEIKQKDDFDEILKQEEPAQEIIEEVVKEPIEKPIEIDIDEPAQEPVEEIKIDKEVAETDIDKPIEILIDDEDEPLIEIASNDIESKKEDISIEKNISTYTFDPKVASDELGLPVDLIEEFIEDFIAQAKEFKEELYSSLDSGNLDKVQTLSHKLKGVAANLRIEDARETLITINTSKDINEIKNNLDLLYKIIAKLAKEEIMQTQNDDLLDDLLLPLEETISANLDTNDKEDEELEKDYIIDIDELDHVEKISYDKTIAANEIGLDENSFNQLFNDFSYEAKLLCENIQNAIKNNDYKTWQQKSIELKSMSDNMRIFDYDDSLTEIINTDDTKIAQKAIDEIKLFITNISG
ncbi:MAG: Hpt domain-containing protein [Campylobacterota bacterium]|nr:Hpt domain-containing protein [Campylobacterota bacterium]